MDAFRPLGPSPAAKHVVVDGQLMPVRLSCVPPGATRSQVEPPSVVRMTLLWAPAARHTVVLAQLTAYQDPNCATGCVQVTPSVVVSTPPPSPVATQLVVLEQLTP